MQSKLYTTLHRSDTSDPIIPQTDLVHIRKHYRLRRHASYDRIELPQKGQNKEEEGTIYAFRQDDHIFREMRRIRFYLSWLSTIILHLSLSHKLCMLHARTQTYFCWIHMV